MNSFLTEEVMRESWVVQDWLEKGRQKGLQEGRQRFHQALLENKFGSLPEWAEERLRSADAIQAEVWDVQHCAPILSKTQSDWIDRMYSFFAEDAIDESSVVQTWVRIEFQRELEQGRREAAQQLLRALLIEKFGRLPVWARERLLGADTTQAEVWGVKMLRAASLEDALALPD